jgi:hypothetical protein
MGLKAQLAKALERAKELAKAGAERDLTEDEITETTTLATTVADLRERIKAADEAAAQLKALAADDGDAPDDDTGDEAPGTKTGPKDRAPGVFRGKSAPPASFGEAFVKSAPYKRFAEDNPSGVGSGTPIDIGKVKVGSLADLGIGRKATLGTPVARLQPVRMPMVDMVDRDRLTVLDLISRGQTAGNFEYVQVTGVTRNAAIVPESTGPADAAALKPLSDMTTSIADAKVYTYADGYDVTNQLLADAPAFASYMDAELRYSLDSVIEDKLLNGTGTSGEPRGLLHTTGVQAEQYTAGTDAMELVKAVRKGITRVTRLPGGTVTAILISPEDDEALDLMQDANERFFGQGPFNSGPATLWGRPRAISERLTPGTVILGDWTQIALLDREGLSVTAFNQHADYARRNMVYVRAELRAAQVIWKPNRMVVVSPTTAP